MDLEMEGLTHQLLAKDGFVFHSLFCNYFLLIWGSGEGSSLGSAFTATDNKIRYLIFLQNALSLPFQSPLICFYHCIWHSSNYLKM